MAETIEGGAYQAVDGTWKDAEGRPLKPHQVAAATDMAAQRAEQAKVQENRAQSPEVLAVRVAIQEQKLAELKAEVQSRPAVPLVGTAMLRDDGDDGGGGMDGEEIEGDDAKSKKPPKGAGKK